MPNQITRSFDLDVGISKPPLLYSSVRELSSDTATPAPPQKGSAKTSILSPDERIDSHKKFEKRVFPPGYRNGDIDSMLICSTLLDFFKY